MLTELLKAMIVFYITHGKWPAKVLVHKAWHANVERLLRDIQLDHVKVVSASGLDYDSFRLDAYVKEPKHGQVKHGK